MQHMNITTDKVQSNEIIYKDNKGTTLIKRGSLIESSSLC